MSTNLDINNTISSEDLKELIHNDDFKNALDKASESRIPVIDYNQTMKDNKSEFIDYMIEGSGIKDKREKKRLKKSFSRVFNKLLDYKYHDDEIENSTKIDKLAEDTAIVLKYFDFMQDYSFKNKLADYGIYIDDSKSRKLTDDYPNINPESWESFNSIISDSCSCKKDIKKVSDDINNNIFENNVPEDLKYSKSNPRGLNKSAFNKLVVGKTLALQSKDKLEDFLTNAIENSIFAAAREELLQEGLEEIK